MVSGLVTEIVKALPAAPGAAPSKPSQMVAPAGYGVVHSDDPPSPASPKNVRLPAWPVPPAALELPDPPAPVDVPAPPELVPAELLALELVPTGVVPELVVPTVPDWLVAGVLPPGAVALLDVSLLVAEDVVLSDDDPFAALELDRLLSDVHAAIAAAIGSKQDANTGETLEDLVNRIL
ncbi:MAG: hypothetical protein ABSC94_05540 [Polyangiaceae bacterium]|jgi:hypothetical protein